MFACCSLMECAFYKINACSINNDIPMPHTANSKRGKNETKREKNAY